MFGGPFIFQIFFVVVYFLGGLVNVDLKIHPHQKMSTSRYCGLQLPALMLIVASYSVLVARQQTYINVSKLIDLILQSVRKVSDTLV